MPLSVLCWRCMLLRWRPDSLTLETSPILMLSSSSYYAVVSIPYITQSDDLRRLIPTTASSKPRTGTQSSTIDHIISSWFLSPPPSNCDTAPPPRWHHAVTSQDRCSRQLCRAVQDRPGHLAERRVPSLDVVVVGLNAMEERTAILPQSIPQVHGVVALPVEPTRAPDQLQLVEVRSVDTVFVHVHQVWKSSGEVERYL